MKKQAPNKRFSSSFKLDNGNVLFFIPGNVPGSKNGKTWTGKFLINSKTTTKYLKESKPFYQKHHKELKECFKDNKPKILLLHLVRDSKRKWDFDNCCNTICDIFVKEGIVEDDNVNYLMPAPLPIHNKLWDYNKNNPGVFIIIVNQDDYINICANLVI